MKRGKQPQLSNLIENSIDKNYNDIRIDLMKLKLSIPTATPIELGHQVDAIIDKKISKTNDD